MSFLPVAAILSGVTLMQFGNTLFAVLLPIRLELMASPAWLVGVVTSAYSLGFLFGCRRAQGLVRTVGHIRAFAALSALCCVFALTFVEYAEPGLWALLRLAMGFCLAGLFITAEGWLNAVTPGHQRGRVLSVYMILTKVANIASQLLLAVGEVLAKGWFVLAGAAFSAALVPVALTRAPQPPLPAVERMGLRRLARLAPAAIAGTTVAGLVNGAVIGLFPVYGARIGLDVPFTVTLLSLLQIGSLVLQWPLGWLSDRTDRRFVIVGCATMVAALSLLLPLCGPGDRWLLALLAFLWGGFALSFYGLCIAHAADFAPPEQMVAVSGSALLAWASGSVAGPVVASALIDLFGAAALFGYAAAVDAALVGFVLYRIVRRAPKFPDARAPFVNLPATSPAVGTIDPRAREPSDENGL
ncbi:putative MFS-type transporter YcaD [bacterium HR40]|nr:putative MFS-type transporter YcaD [bacterium HR40]